MDIERSPVAHSNFLKEKQHIGNITSPSLTSMSSTASSGGPSIMKTKQIPITTTSNKFMTNLEDLEKGKCPTDILLTTKTTKTISFNDNNNNNNNNDNDDDDDETEMCVNLVTSKHVSNSIGHQWARVLLCLKPVDRWTLAFLVGTFPLLFMGGEADGSQPTGDISSILWSGVFLRLVLVPAVIYFRYFLAQTRCPTELFLGWSWRGVALDPPICLLYWALDWYPAAMYGYLYSETGLIIANLHGSLRHDDDMKRYEYQVFLSQPAMELREWIPSKLLGEYLHFCYFTYYVIIVGMMGVIYLFRPREYFDRATSALSLGFFTCFAFYIAYPVEGPYWTFPRADPGQVSYFSAYLVHWVLMASSKGTAMPSSHCAISMVCWVAAWVYHVRLAIMFIFLVPGLIFATVWCGFHYGLDSTTGTLWGLFCAIVGIMLAKSMPYNRPVHDMAYGLKKRQNLATALAKWI